MDRERRPVGRPSAKEPLPIQGVLIPARAIHNRAFGLQKACNRQIRRKGKREKSLQIAGGRTWIRTRDLFLIREARQATELLRAGALEPTLGRPHHCRHHADETPRRALSSAAQAPQGAPGPAPGRSALGATEQTARRESRGPRRQLGVSRAWRSPRVRRGGDRRPELS